MPDITTTVVDVSKTFTLDADQTQRAIAYAESYIGAGSTAAEKKEWLARHMFILLREAIFNREREIARTNADSGVSKLPVTEV